MAILVLLAVISGMMFALNMLGRHLEAVAAREQAKGDSLGEYLKLMLGALLHPSAPNHLSLLIARVGREWQDK